MNKGNVQLFLDSGAFSAFTQGVEIDIQEYIAFIKEHEEHLEVYANLDVIGAPPEASWDNQRTMERAGLNPMPCFHYGEDPKWLRRYMKKCDYIALGGMAADKSGKALSTEKRMKWLDVIFQDYICDSSGTPTVKVHGFGMTSHELMWRYPWYSVDSTSWVVTGRLGSIYVPRRKEGQWNHRLRPWKVSLSERSPNKSEAGKHLSSYSPMERAVILQYIKEQGHQLGRSSFRKEPEAYELAENERWVGAKKDVVDGVREVELMEELGLCNTYQHRDEINIKYFLALEASFPEWPWAMKLGEKRGFGL